MKNVKQPTERRVNLRSLFNPISAGLKQSSHPRPRAKTRFSLVPDHSGYFYADLKSFLSNLLNMHFPMARSSVAFLKKKVMLVS
jgi:hypothetical protein